MKKQENIPGTLCLGDLISAVSACSINQQEAAAAVADLFASGRVSLLNKGRKVQARVK